MVVALFDPVCIYFYDHENTEMSVVYLVFLRVCWGCISSIMMKS